MSAAQQVSERQELYRLMVRQLKYDGFENASQAVSESTLESVAGVDPEGDLLARLVGKGMDGEIDCAATRGARLDSWNTVYSYFGQGEKMITRNISSHPREVRALNFSQDGQYLLSADAGGSVHMHLVEKMMAFRGEAKSATTDAVARVYEGNQMSVEDVCFHPTSPYFFTGGRDGHVKLYEYSRPRMKRPAVVLQDEYMVRSLSAHPLGKHVLAGTEHPIVRLWDIEGARLYRAPDDICDMNNPAAGMVNDVEFSPDGRTYASANSDGSLKIWDPSAPRWVVVPITNCHCGAEVTSVKYSKTGKELLTAGMVNDVEFSPDGRTYASANSDGSLKIWDPSAPRWVVVPITNCHCGAEVTSVKYSKTGKELLTAGKDGMVRIFETRNWKCLGTYGRPRQIQHKATARFTAYEDAIIAVLHEKDRVKIIDRNMSDTRTFSAAAGTSFSSQIRALAVSPVAPFIATGDDSLKMRLWTPVDPVDDAHNLDADNNRFVRNQQKFLQQQQGMLPPGQSLPPGQANLPPSQTMEPQQ
eukprot:TRINITY_DN19521_c0_g1_i1.p1 TRINITY_DN19521_c0_g1~~TRINITY_DN19521_c0_g1_i1.p1  ORF type:complete len:530 (+),score=169.80 TRINITY_DN19521_c0_g1_i1:83-1672(+)